MADPKKISELTTAGPLTGVELLPIVQNSGTLQTNLATVAIFATSAVTNDVAAVSLRLDNVSAAVSANAAAITSVNNVVSVLDVRLTAVSASVSVLNVQMLAVQASISAINSALAAIDVSAITALDTRVSALEIRVSAVSAAAVANAAAITSVNNVVSALDVRVAAVSASVSALQVQVNAVSVLTSLNTAAITSVNAVVSTKAFRNGDFLTNVQYIDFNTTTSYAPAPGRLTWDIESGTLDLGLTGTVNLLVGQRTVAQIYNNTGATLLKDKAVRVTGAQGQRLTGALAQADSDADSLTIFGVMLETVSVNRSGYVATDGLVRNFNTGSFADGDILYLSPVSAGELTITKPVAPQHLVQVGYVVNGGSVGAGSIYIKVQNGYELGELHDVKTSTSTSLATGEVLAWNAGASVWTNSTALIEAQASISALNIQLAAVSARTSVNAAAITSINNVVSALEIRVSTVSAVVSALQVQTNAVSALVSSAFVSIGQRVLKAGDTMTGQLAIAVAANTIGVSVSGGLVVTSVVNFTGDSALLLHSGTTATRPTSVTPGLIRFNSGSNTFEGYTSATWGAIGGGGGATGGGSNQAFYLNDTVVSVSYSIPSGKNAGTFGPITIASGVTVEVPSGSTWTVV